MLDTNNYSSLKSFKKLTTTTKDAIRKLSSVNGPLSLICLNVATQKESETIALCIGLALELCFNYEADIMFNEFRNPRNFLYSCLKVTIFIKCVPKIFFMSIMFYLYNFLQNGALQSFPTMERKITEKIKCTIEI